MVTGAQVATVAGCRLAVQRESPGRNGVSWYARCESGEDSGGADTLEQGKRAAINAVAYMMSRRG